MTRPYDEPARIPTQAAKIFAKVDKARERLGLKDKRLVRAGFDYAKAIRCIRAKAGYGKKDIADCMGCSRQALDRILKGVSVPNHVAGELLWGLYVQFFGKEDARKQLLTPEHREDPLIGGAPRRHRAR